jgi:hypothetical protein
LTTLRNFEIAIAVTLPLLVDPALVNESGEAFAMSNAHLDNAKNIIVK